MYYLISTGDGLAKTQKGVRMAPEKYLSNEKYEDYGLDDQNETSTINKKIDLLKERLNMALPISPYGLFCITKASFLHLLVNI